MLGMPAKGIPQSSKQFGRKCHITFFGRFSNLERRLDRRHLDTEVTSHLHRPIGLTGFGYNAIVSDKFRIFTEYITRQAIESGSDNTAALPNGCDLGEI